MQSFAIIFTALTALTIEVAGIPVPAQTTTPSQPCPSTSLKANQSTVFGWQLAGSAANSDDLSQTCSQLQSNLLTKWSSLGLSTSSIETPVCNALTPNAESALPKVAAANTKVFTTLLTNSFGSNTSAFGYLCDNLRYVQLDGFLLDSALVTNATCQLAGSQLNPEPFTTIGGATVNQSAVAQYKEAQSQLFATIYTSQASSSSDLTSLCANAAQPVRQGRWDKLTLNGSCIKDTICATKQPLSMDDASNGIKNWTTQSFLAVILNISNQPGYKKWLCHNLDVDSMNAVGMDGGAVKSGVCSVAFPGEDGSGSWGK